MRQGRTDAWIAHQLEVTVQQIQSFKREHGLDEDQPVERVGTVAGDYDDEIDLRAEDDALIAAELEAAETRRAEEEEELEAAEVSKAATEEEGEASDQEESDDQGERPSRRRRGRRGGRRARPRTAAMLEATFDHGEEGYGLWLDPSVQDDPVYAEYWAGHRPVEVTIDEDQIVIRRAGEDDGDEED